MQALHAIGLCLVGLLLEDPTPSAKGWVTETSWHLKNIC